MIKKLPVDVSSFITMRQNDYLYVDKTQQMYSLIRAARLFFLSRPRRFGKTLLIGALEAFFLGKRDLFSGLWVDSISDCDWQSHPVIRLSFAGSLTAFDFEKNLIGDLEDIAQRYNITLKKYDTLVLLFKHLVMALSEINKVVILIDEYDYALLRNLDKPAEAIKIRNLMQSFFSVVKDLDEQMRFVFITGISKFSKASLFSGLNNLIDLSQDVIAAELVGYTSAELVNCYQPYLEQLAHAQSVSLATILEKLQEWYNGYQFSRAPVKVYNPFSINLACFKNNIANYWIESGTPSFLIFLLGRLPAPVQDIEGVCLKENSLSSFDVESIPLHPLLFQTGYLTIGDYDNRTGEYLLRYPNREVSQAFKDYLVAAFAHVPLSELDQGCGQIRQALQNNNIELFCDALRTLFSNVPYQLHISQERYYHSLIQMIGTIMGLAIESEVSVSSGRIDLVITFAPYRYVIELKFDSTPAHALDQIEERRYYQRYLIGDYVIVLVGIALNRRHGFLWIEHVSRIVDK